MKAKRWIGSFAAVAIVLFLSAALVPRQGMAATDSSGGTSLGASDRRFVTEVARGGTHEVEMGKLALEKASSDAVKAARASAGE